MALRAGAVLGLKLLSRHVRQAWPAGGGLGKKVALNLVLERAVGGQVGLGWRGGFAEARDLGWLGGSKASLRHVRQVLQSSVILSSFVTKMGSSWTPTNPDSFKARRARVRGGGQVDTSSD